ncbi:POP1-domain-containing protein [Cystobasidium minutum MCA 4210]|uniref:POP1-domain-containing protein n=1 Tax=Cystobasidium minutum MCA 4210 TaxID=1397322 RepID=UPI0034CD02AC|eukprot:jgi/Rhomi1/29744/CE29743_426
MPGISDSGPSAPKRARFRSQASNDAAAMKVDNVEIEKYALSRGIEISAMEKAMKASRDSGAQRAFQSLPRHLRRRAASHNIRRLPKRLRAKAKLEIVQDQPKALKKLKFRQLSITKRRKLLRGSRVEILHGRQREKAWLETHIWHAKRMRMIDTWGYRLAYTPTDKAFRPSYRASMHGAIVHDASYMQVLELKGDFEALKEVLSFICDPGAVPPYSKRYASGVRECEIDLYEFEAYPCGLIGPATIFWEALPTSSSTSVGSSSLRKLFVRFHPSILGAVAANVQRCLDAVLQRATRKPSTSTQAVEEAMRKTVVASYRTFCTFEVTGPMATDTIKACLRPINETPSEKMSAWKNLMPPAGIPAGSILSLDVQDPRLHFPPTLARSEKSHSKAALFRPAEELAQNRHFWDAAYRKELVAPRYSKKELDDRRAKLLAPGTRLQAQADDNSIPVMLIQRSIRPNYVDKDFHGRALGTDYFDKDYKGRSEKNAISGWTLILPQGWGGAFWHSLAFADTRIGGLRERAQQHFEAGCPIFPEDYACTRAFKIEIDKKAKDASARWHRTPASKRVNFDKLKTSSPWRPAFSNIVSSIVSAWHVDRPEDPNAHGGEMVLGKGIEPYLTGGSLIQKLLNAKPEERERTLNRSIDEELEECGYVALQKIYREAVNALRAKRGLRPVQPLLANAFVKVRLNPLTRGSPKYNAMIYIPDEGQVYGLRHILKFQKLENEDGVSRPHNKKPPSGVKEWPKNYPRDRHLELPNTIVEQWEQALLLQPEYERQHIFRVPPAENIMGYVTTGNMSLARGKGQGIGAVSLFQLSELIGYEIRACLKKEDLKLLVLFRNPASQFCRLGTLEVLE